MFGSEELIRLRQQKEALILESHINRLTLMTEAQLLKQAAANAKERLSAPRIVAPALILLSAVAGFSLTRARKRSRTSLISRVVSLAKYAIPAYRIWRSIANRPKSPEPA